MNTPKFIIHHSTFIITSISLIFVILHTTGCYKEQSFLVTADFSIEVIGNDYSVPVKVKITNNTIGAETYQWTLTGASPETSTNKDPGIIEYDTQGNYTIKMEAANRYGGKNSKEITIKIDADIHIGFAVTNTQSYYPDATINIVNTTTGANTYEWLFAGGTPAFSSQLQPGNIVFNTPGLHIVTLKVGNGKETYTKDTTITVLPALVNDFTITWAAENNDMEVPFTAILLNNSISATQYSWAFDGAVPNTATNVAPVVIYNKPGTYTISLTASNDKKSLVVTKTITLLPNSNLFKFTDIHLGINTAQNTIGSYFSSLLRSVLRSSDVNPTNGNQIDFAYFGLNHTFSYNKFISPDSVQAYTFSAIPNALNTQFINSQENCNCAGLTTSNFDAMTDDAVLRSTTINQTSAGYAQFNSSVLPRIILFNTIDGRKGAIKLKQFIDAGQQSYIVCDIKVMKKP